MWGHFGKPQFAPEDGFLACLPRKDLKAGASLAYSSDLRFQGLLSPSSSGLGRRPLTAKTRVRLP
jgi:hypothetical protein